MSKTTRISWQFLSIFFILFLSGLIGAKTDNPAGERPTLEEATKALRKAVQFFSSSVSCHGGYVWKYSGDLSLREGEGIAGETKIWVQPPGTPTIGEAFLDAYEATGGPLHLNAARDAAYALVRGQLRSGGWNYSIEFDLDKRRKYAYRDSVGKIELTVPNEKTHIGGWAVWKKRQNRGNITVLDDDTTQSALRFLMRVDKVLGFNDEKIHDAAQYALESVLKAQYPNGAWSHYYDRLPIKSPDPEYYPLKKASYPQSWSRTWTKDWNGCYMLNDSITPDAIATMLDAYDIYGEERYLASAERGGEFLLLSQMPAPQPAWVQQYDRHMRPVWDRKFEPPAITGLESQNVLETFLLLYRKTGKEKYLEPVPRAIAYLRKSQLPDGRLARFYELNTNRPLYFTRNYRLTYSSADAPTHYAFIVNSRLDAIEKKYRKLLKMKPANLKTFDGKRAGKITPKLEKRVREIIAKMDNRGAWVEQGWVRNRDSRKVEPESGIIYSRTFVENVRVLSRFIAASKQFLGQK